MPSHLRCERESRRGRRAHQDEALLGFLLRSEPPRVREDQGEEQGTRCGDCRRLGVIVRSSLLERHMSVVGHRGRAAQPDDVVAHDLQLDAHALTHGSARQHGVRPNEVHQSVRQARGGAVAVGFKLNRPARALEAAIQQAPHRATPSPSPQPHRKRKPRIPTVWSRTRPILAAGNTHSHKRRAPKQSRRLPVAASRPTLEGPPAIPDGPRAGADIEGQLVDSASDPLDGCRPATDGARGGAAQEAQRQRGGPTLGPPGEGDGIAQQRGWG
eukprot:1539557-Prymnesium_polylepis.1